MGLFRYLGNLFQYKIALFIIFVVSVAFAGNFDNLGFNTNTISSRNTNGNILFDPNGTGQVRFNDLTATTVPYLDANKGLVSSAVTPTELGYLSGVTSSIQTQLSAPTVGVITLDGQASTPANPSAGFYKVYVKDSDGRTYILNSSGVEAGLGGGGGGSSISWEEPANSPSKTISSNYAFYSYVPALAQELYTEIKVPASYSAGTQIFLKCNIYSADTSGTFLLQTVSTLVRDGTDTISSTTNQRTSTNAAITATGATQNIPQSVIFDLTSSTGTINSVAVSANDTINIKMTRGTDTATGNVAFLFKQCEVTL